VKIDWSNPLAKDLVFTTLLDSMFPTELVSGVRATFSTDTAPAPSFSKREKGGMMSQVRDADDHGQLTFNTPFETPDGLTMAVLANVNTEANNWRTAVNLKQATFLAWYIPFVNSNKASSLYWSTTTEYASGNNLVIENEWVLYLVTMGPSQTAPVFYRNGAYHSTSGTGSIDYNDSKTGVDVLGSTNWPNETFDGDIANVMIWNKFFQEADVKLLYNDPYQFLIPA